MRSLGEKQLVAWAPWPVNDPFLDAIFFVRSLVASTAQGGHATTWLATRFELLLKFPVTL